MFCTNCGKNLEPGTVFCDNCGKKTEDYVPQKKIFESKTTDDNYKSPVCLREKQSKTWIESDNETKGAAFVERKAFISKEKVVEFAMKFALWFLLFLVCAIIVAIFVFAVQYDHGIKITSAFDDDVCKYLSFSKILQYMYSGCTNFSPTTVSVSLSVTVYMLLYSLPLISLLMFIGVLISSSKIRWHTSFSILNLLSTAVLMTIIPLALYLVPNMSNILAEEVSIIAEDIGAVSYMPLIILGVINTLLIIVSYVILVFLLRRIKNEK